LHPIRRPILYLAATALVALSVMAGMLAWASLYATGVEARLVSWQKHKRLPTEETWQATFADINAVLRVDSSNPDYLERLPELYRWHALMQGGDRAGSRRAYLSALNYYRQLARLRPAWPGYWVGIVQAKYALWEYDDEMRHALRMAVKQGPWFEDYQHAVLLTGYHGWPFLDLETQQAVSDMLDRAMQLQPEETIRIALDYGFRDRIWPYLENDAALAEVYEQELQRREKLMQRR